MQCTETATLEEKSRSFQKYTTMPANEGERTVLLVGWTVKAVFVDPDHETLAAKVAELLNEQEERGDSE